IREEYRGIRPAPGYPACPDHAVKEPLFALLRAEAIGMTLTENFAMLPTAAVSGFYFSHPDAQYFAVGRIGNDQLDDFAQRGRIDRKSTRLNYRPTEISPLSLHDALPIWPPSRDSISRIRTRNTSPSAGLATINSTTSRNAGG